MGNKEKNDVDGDSDKTTLGDDKSSSRTAQCCWLPWKTMSSRCIHNSHSHSLTKYSHSHSPTKYSHSHLPTKYSQSHLLTKNIHIYIYWQTFTLNAIHVHIHPPKQTTINHPKYPQVYRIFKLLSKAKHKMSFHWMQIQGNGLKCSARRKVSWYVIYCSGDNNQPVLLPALPAESSCLQ